jgi:hypothetical protein
MASPLINTTPINTHYPIAWGSGSLVTSPALEDLGSLTTFAPPHRILYLLTELLCGHTGNSSPELRLREKSADIVGSWLASTEGMVVEVTNIPPGTYARALDELKTNLGVTLTYIARCLAMQRSAIYRWYDGRNPHPANRARLETLREFAVRWSAAQLPSLRNYWESTVPGTTVTLGELLSSQTLEIATLNAALDSVMSHAGTMPPKTPRLGFPSRRRDRQKDRDRLSVLAPTTSHEDEDENGSG